MHAANPALRLLRAANPVRARPAPQVKRKEPFGATPAPVDDLQVRTRARPPRALAASKQHPCRGLPVPSSSEQQLEQRSSAFKHQDEPIH